MQENWHDAEQRVQRAHELFDRGRWEAALEEFRAAIDVYPHNFQWHYDMGLTLDQLGRFDEAVAAYRAALTLEPGDIESLNALGIDLTRTGAAQAGIACFERCAELDPDYEPSLCNRIMAYTDLGDHVKAEEMFHLARELSDECPYCLFNLGESQYRRAMYREAIQSWRNVLRVDPDHGDVHYRIGYAYRDLARKRAAKRHFRLQLRRDPGHIDALIELGRLALEDDHPTTAREKFRHALDLEPSNALAWNLLGEAEIACGNAESARTALERCMRLDPDQVWARLGLAEICLDADDPAKAREWIREELALKHDDLDTLERAGQLALELNAMDLAERAFAAILVHDPRDARGNHLMVSVLAGQGRWADAVAQAERAFELDPNNLPTVYHHAAALARLGRLADAARVAEVGRAMFPADRAMARLATRIRLARLPLLGRLVRLTFRR